MPAGGFSSPDLASIFWVGSQGIDVCFFLVKEVNELFSRNKILENYWTHNESEKLTCGCFQKWWYPQIIHFSRVFHYKPSILGYPYFWKHPCGTQKMMIFQDFCIHFIPLISRQEGGRYRRRGKEAKTEAARRVFFFR